MFCNCIYTQYLSSFAIGCNISTALWTKERERWDITPAATNRKWRGGYGPQKKMKNSSTTLQHMAMAAGAQFLNLQVLSLSLVCVRFWLLIHFNLLPKFSYFSLNFWVWWIPWGRPTEMWKELQTEMDKLFETWLKTWELLSPRGCPHHWTP